jgi:pyruvate formate lyase activating enzyme
MYKLFDLQRLSMENGPGLRTTLFFSGCPLRCAWCHNPEGQSYNPVLMYFPSRCIQCAACEHVCPVDAISYDPETGPTIDRGLCTDCGDCAAVCPTDSLIMSARLYSLEEIMHTILRDRLFFDRSQGGVTFSGGEPLAQNMKNLEKLMKAIKEERINLAIDTCGDVSPSSIQTASRYADSFLYDFKHLDPEKHKEFTGFSNERIINNLIWLSDNDMDIHIRIPVIPGFNGCDEDLASMAEWLADNVKASTISLLPYHRFGSDKYDRIGIPDRKKLFEPPSAEVMEEALEIFKSKGLQQAQIGGAILVAV